MLIKLLPILTIALALTFTTSAWADHHEEKKDKKRDEVKVKDLKKNMKDMEKYNHHDKSGRSHIPPSKTNKENKKDKSEGERSE